MNYGVFRRYGPGWRRYTRRIPWDWAAASLSSGMAAMLRSLARTPDDTTTIFSRHRTLDTGTGTNTFYTFTDHLGTPIIQTDTTDLIA